MQNDKTQRCHEDDAFCRSCPERCYKNDPLPKNTAPLGLLARLVRRLTRWAARSHLRPQEGRHTRGVGPG